MFSVFFIFLSAAVILADQVPIENQYGEKILGGTVTDTSLYPYQLSLECLGLHSCGASLIGRKWVLTAAHCVSNIFTNFLSIRAGAIAKQTGGVEVKVVKKYVHPSFKSTTLDYDLAVLELEEEVDPDYAEIVPLANEDDIIKKGDMGTIVGWGVTAENSSMSSQLIVTEVPVLDQKQCGKVMGSLVTRRMFCAGFLKGGKDACQGDSGGPFIVNGIQVGIISWGNGCGRPRNPGVYTYIAVLRKYIKSVSGI